MHKLCGIPGRVQSIAAQHDIQYEPQLDHWIPQASLQDEVDFLIGATLIRHSNRHDSVSASLGQTKTPAPPILYHMSDQGPIPALTEEQAQDQEIAANMFTDLMNKTEFTTPALDEPGQVTFLGESASINWLVRDHNHPLHYPTVAANKQSGFAHARLDDLEMDILRQRGAFRLPPKSIRDELVEAFFKWVHPVVPAINKTHFMRDYDDPKKTTSIFLLQAIMLAGSCVGGRTCVHGNAESRRDSARTFYNRAKALYNVGFETDRIKMIQGLILMSWFCGTPEAVTENSYFWISAAISVAEGAGLHRSIEQTNLGRSQKRTWKRIWWTLYIRDREIAITLGRPCVIKLEDSDVQPITADDFINDDDAVIDCDCSSSSMETQFFLELVQLCDITTVILSEQYSVDRHRPRDAAFGLVQGEAALNEWLEESQMRWSETGHNFWSAMLFLHYHTAVCLLHRPYLSAANCVSPAMDQSAGRSTHSRNMAYRSADEITHIVRVLQSRGELLCSPPFVQYSLMTALMLHKRREYDPDLSDLDEVRQKMKMSLAVLQEIYNTAPINDSIHMWLQRRPQPQPTGVTNGNISKKQIRDKVRSQSFHSQTATYQLSRGPVSGAKPAFSHFHDRRHSTTIQDLGGTSWTDSQPATTIQHALTKVDTTASVPGVPAEMLSVFDLTPISVPPPPPVTSSQRENPAPTVEYRSSGASESIPAAEVPVGVAEASHEEGPRMLPMERLMLESCGPRTISK